MLYRFLRVYVRWAMSLYCRKITIQNPDRLRWKGPLLLAANHPNSFLDAIVLDILFQQPIWSLARGDAFRNNFIRKILHRLKILPVYRTSEGTENLGINYQTFNTCQEIFRRQGLVLIFSEGRCINEWKLRPLKKGTARLAIQCWENGIPLRVLPVGINYSSFRRFGKNIRLHLGDAIGAESLAGQTTDGGRIRAFNESLNTQLSELVIQFPETDECRRQQSFHISGSTGQTGLLALPAAIGWLLHAPLYLPVRSIVRAKAIDSDHYDSILFCLLLLSAPFYWLVCTALLALITGPLWAAIALPLFPLTAWCRVQWKLRREFPSSAKLVLS